MILQSSKLYGTVNIQFKKDLNVTSPTYIRHFYSDNWFLDSLHKFFLNQTSLDLRKQKWTFLNREFAVFVKKFRSIYFKIKCRISSYSFRGNPKVTVLKAKGHST